MNLYANVYTLCLCYQVTMLTKLKQAEKTV